MKLTIKLVSIFALLLLASPIVLFNGCGTVLNGSSTGACGEAAAPFGSAISPSAGTLDPPYPTGSCYPHVVFTVLDSNKQPMNGVCVELYTDGASVMAKEPPGEVNTCLSAYNNPLNSLITATDSSGNVTLELITPDACTGIAKGTKVSFFIHASSGAAAGTWTASVTCP